MSEILTKFCYTLCYFIGISFRKIFELDISISYMLELVFDISFFLICHICELTILINWNFMEIQYTLYVIYCITHTYIDKLPDYVGDEMGAVQVLIVQCVVLELLSQPEKYIIILSEYIL